jgi:hypothetical protein
VIFQVAHIVSLAVDPMHCAFMVAAITHFILGKSVNPVFGAG